jgi:hypothetical protein
MACFLVPGTEAIVTSIVKKAVSSHEEASGEAEAKEEKGSLTWKKKLTWLTSMLWGGAALLALEHIWHGEVVLYPPFLTAMSDPADTAVMLGEMSTIGVSMAVMVTVCWVVMVLIADHVPAIKKKLAGKEA